ncbi:hypothetical protein WN944_004100 [Citrus x changshan-huyou]|uniref:SHSP domain-containing protein n=3 Tax=Citrus TaxID=2706 RepID=A0ACB8JUR8_CITSI|nr:SHSP domain-containing protein [Citrus sinensis]KDO37909.1 hypothetical protein CISIN_1g031640mg [Citrus sinensis]
MSQISRSRFAGAVGYHHPPFPLSDDTWNGGQFQHVYQFSPPMMIPTRIDWHDTPECHVFKADLSGFHKHDVKVEIEDGRVLCISGEKKIEKEERTDEGHRLEVAVGKFSRRFQLPENAMVDRITAHIANSTLTVTVPKKDIKKHHGHSRSIKITGV